MMYQNSNQEMVRELAAQTMKVHRLRNLMAGIAIALTMVLILAVCGAGVSTVQAILKESEMNPGPGTNGISFTGDEAVQKKLETLPQIEWADMTKLCTAGTPKNPEFSGMTVKFMGVDEGYYGHNYVDLISGSYPSGSGELLMSDTMAERLGMTTEPGQKFTVEITVQKNGETQNVPVEMTISGFYDNPLRQIVGYEELYTTVDFQERYNPELGAFSRKIYTKVEGLDAKTSQQELISVLDGISQEIGGAAYTFISPADLTMIWAGGGALLLLIMLCGYFLIYNIFYISTVNDIRFIGSMRTIGMTGKQIRSMMGWQIRRIAFGGILAGMVLGTGLNLLVIRLLHSMEFSFSRFYTADKSLIAAVLASVVFTALTVWISSRKAVSLAAKVSPVEASRFRVSGRKKTVFAVVSFALSGILFCVLFTGILGYDVEYMVDRQISTDFELKQQNAYYPGEEPYEPLAPSLVEKINNLAFVEDQYVYYLGRGTGEEADEFGNYPESEVWVKYDESMKRALEKNFSSSEFFSEEKMRSIYLDGGNCRTGIMGLPTEAFDMEMAHRNIYDGEADMEKFASGDYLIFEPSRGVANGADYIYEGPGAGEKLTLSLYDPETGEYAPRTFTILAVVGSKKDDNAGIGSGIAEFWIPDTAFREIYGEKADTMISNILINTAEGDEEEQLETLQSLLTDTANTQITLDSKYETRLSQQVQKDQKLLIGIFVALVFGFIGIMNVTNTIVTGVLSRKIEYAALQSIGMTRRQMCLDIFASGVKMILGGVLLLIPVGIPVTVACSVYPLSTGFDGTLFAIAVAAVILTGLAVTLLIAWCMTAILNKKTVVERLREAE